MPSRAPRASRRAILAGGVTAGAALVATAATGCGVDRSSGGADAAALESSEPAVDADSDLVTDTSAEIASTAALATATGDAVRRLRPLSRRLVRLHEAHLEELGWSDDLPADPVVDGPPAAARTRLLRAEERLQRHLVRAALDAESGALAQVFAAMAAAIAQERTVAG